MKIGIIGFGNLGSAFATGLIKQGIPQDNILICDNMDSAIKKAHSLGINNTNVHTLIENSDVVVLSVKPYSLDALGVTPEILIGKTIVSFVAGIGMNQLKEKYNCDIVRVMPTIAMENTQSVTAICFEDNYPLKQEFIDLFTLLGQVFVCDEDKLESVTALASCGLGFAAYILDCFTKCGENLGFCEEDAVKIVSQTFNAAIEMSDFEILMGRVATKGGITQQGINFMAENNVNKLIDGAVKTAYAKASEYKK